MAVYYLDARDGRDSGDGSGGAPWKTLRYAHGRIAPGDTVRLRGNNRDRATFYSGEENILTISKRGVTFEADKGHRPTITSGWDRRLLRKVQGTFKGSQWYDYCMPSTTTGLYQDGTRAYDVAGKNSRHANWFTVTADDVTFRGLVFQGMDRNVIKGDKANRLSVIECDFYWFRRQAFNTKGGGGCRIHRCRFVHGTLMRMDLAGDGTANAWFNMFPVTAGATTPDGYTGEIVDCVIDAMAGDGLIIQESQGSAKAPFLIRGNRLYNSEGIYIVGSEYVIIDGNTVTNTINRNMYRQPMDSQKQPPGILVKDERASKMPSKHLTIVNNLVAVGGGFGFGLRFNKLDPKHGIPNNAGVLFAGNTIIGGAGRIIDLTFNTIAGAKVGPVLVQNNVFYGTKWGATPGPKAANAATDIAYTRNAMATNRTGFDESLVVPLAAMRLRDPEKPVKSVDNVPYYPVLDAAGNERYVNFDDIAWQPNGTMSDFDPANYQPLAGSPLAGEAKAYPATVNGPHTGNTLTVPGWVRLTDLWSTTDRDTLGCLEPDSRPGTKPPPDPPDPPDPDEPGDPGGEPEPGLTELEFAGGWTILVDDGMLRARDPDGGLFDFALVPVE